MAPKQKRQYWICAHCAQWTWAPKETCFRCGERKGTAPGRKDQAADTRERIASRKRGSSRSASQKRSRSKRRRSRRRKRKQEEEEEEEEEAAGSEEEPLEDDGGDAVMKTAPQPPQTKEEADKAVKQLESLSGETRAFMPHYAAQLAAARSHRDQLKAAEVAAQPLHGRLAQAAKRRDELAREEAVTKECLDEARELAETAAKDHQAAQRATAAAQQALDELTAEAGRATRTVPAAELEQVR